MKHLKLKSGDLIKKISGETFGGHGDNPVPFIEIKAIQPWSNGNYRINNLYVISQEKVSLIDDIEKEFLVKIWDKASILQETIKPNFNTSCYREDNGEPKQALSQSNFRKAVFRFNSKNPTGNYEAYRCKHCNNIHIGKTNE
jgi:hypothetical protein